jgi:hypothetical protein
MDHEVQGRDSVAFDLTSLASEFDRDTRFSRVLVRVVAVIFSFFAAVSLWLLLFRPSNLVAPYSSGPLTGVMVFGLISVYAWWASIPLGAAPRRLLVTRDGIRLEQIPGRKGHSISWSDPRFKLQIYDLRGLPKIRLDGRVRIVLFRVRIRWEPDSAISQEAFDRIVNSAQEHGLRIDRREATFQGPGTRTLVTVYRAPS